MATFREIKTYSNRLSTGQKVQEAHLIFDGIKTSKFRVAEGLDAELIADGLRKLADQIDSRAKGYHTEGGIIIPRFMD